MSTQPVPAAVRPSPEARCIRALTRVPEGSAISHETAATLLGLPLPPALVQGDADPVHISVPKPAHPRVAGLRIHRVTGPIPTARTGGGVLVTRGARLWFDMAPVLGRDDLVVLGDAVLHRDMATEVELAGLIAVYAGRRGLRAARTAVVLLNRASKSPMETRVRLLLVDHGFTGFLVNRPVLDAAGGWLSTPDIQVPWPMVAIEYEGDQHRTDRRQWQEDIRRYELMAENGWVVIRLMSADVLRTPDRTVARIQRALDRRR